MVHLRSGKGYKKQSPGVDNKVERPTVENGESLNGLQQESPKSSLGISRLVTLCVLTMASAYFFFPGESRVVLREISKIVENSVHGTLLSKTITFGRSFFIEPANDSTTGPEVDRPVRNQDSTETNADDFLDDEFAEFEFKTDNDDDDDDDDDDISSSSSLTKNDKDSKGGVEGDVITKTKPNTLTKTDEFVESNYARKDITNAYDFAIREEIDKADDLLEKKEINKALSSYEAILKHHPSSVRARLGKCRTLRIKAELLQSNPVLEQAIEEYHKFVFEVPFSSVPESLLREAGRSLIEMQSFRGWNRDAILTAGQMLELFPSDIDFMTRLGVLYLESGFNQKGKSVFSKILSLEPDNPVALVHMGFILKSIEGNLMASLKYFQEGLKSNMSDTQHGRFYFNYGDALYRLNRHEEAHDVYKLAADRGIFLSQWQRSIYNCKGLVGKLWWTKQQTGVEKFLTTLENNWEMIRDEGLRLLSNDQKAFNQEEEGLRDFGDWKEFMIYLRGKRIDDNCKKVPQTCAVLNEFKLETSCSRGQIKFSLLHPNTHIWPHCGATNCRIRAHLGLVIPEGEQSPTIRVGAPDEAPRRWIEGKFIIFDDSFEHEVWHNGTETRLVLIVDIWHPDIPLYERKHLTPI